MAAATTVAVSARSMSLILFSSVTSPPQPLHGYDACPRAEANVPMMHPRRAEGTAPYRALDEAILGECVGELEVLPERGDEANDEDRPEREAAASKH